MLVWLDGTYGVGKTSVAQEIKKLLLTNDIEILESDMYYNEMINENPYLALGGALPQNNQNFINKFKKVVEDNLKNSDKIVIAVMALTQKECKEQLYDYFINSNIPTLHIILTANIETIKSRIDTDSNRDKVFALQYIEENIKFFENNYKDDIYIGTDNKTVEEIAKIILQNIKIK